MNKEELKKLKETVAYFGHWYDVIGEERVSILEKSIEYIAKLEKRCSNYEMALSKMEKGTCDICKETEKDKQLTKAKELLKKFMPYVKEAYLNQDISSIRLRFEDMAEAEEFLSEVEK